MQTDIKKLREHNHEFFAWVVGDPIRGVPNISQGVLMRLAEMVEVACKDLELAEAMIHDLNKETNERRPLKWKKQQDIFDDVVGILRTSDKAMYICDIEQELLRQGIMPTNMQIELVLGKLGDQLLLRETFGGVIIVGGKVWESLPNPKPEPTKYADH